MDSRFLKKKTSQARLDPIDPKIFEATASFTATQVASVPGSTKAEVRHHDKASRRLATMLLDMRSNATGGLSFLKGLDALFKVGPKEARRRSCAGMLEEQDKLITAADENLFQLEFLSVHVIDCVKAATTSANAQQYTKLIKEVESQVDSAVASMRVDSQASKIWDKLAHKIRGEHSEERSAERALSPAELFLHIPLTMYVQNTLHLYEMLARLNSEILRSSGNATGATANMPFTFQLRKVLDQNSQPYSWLVFALMAAFQIFFKARDVLQSQDSSTSIMNPLSILASNPPTAPPSSNWRDKEGLMFRGLWVGPCIDEHRARHMYAFNSWSRTLPSCLFVLNFYASCLPIAQAPDWHLLLLVGRRWSQNPWVLPVQFFGGPDVGDAEKELIVPPFVSLKLEEDLELQSGMSQAELKKRCSEICSRWELPHIRMPRSGSLSPSPLGSLGDLVGPELWQLLSQTPGLVSNHWDEKDVPLATSAPRVTVRFVSQMELRPALRKLFEEDSQQLLAFPPPATPKS